ncbi:MAG TPA: hypothetical protein VMU04_18230 [Candidatus Acidoferrum sp.]|nr:hypothetical protein [Candidatus Acidoferrum sp.]
MGPDAFARQAVKPALLQFTEAAAAINAKEHGYEYARKVYAAFPEVPKMADFCVHWFRLAQDRLKPGQRAGLVGTKTIRQNESREASLDYIVANGDTITEAVSHQVWSGEAAVHVALVNWLNGQQPGTKKALHPNR